MFKIFFFVVVIVLHVNPKLQTFHDGYNIIMYAYWNFVHPHLPYNLELNQYLH